MPCIACKRETKLVSHGLCDPCYRRKRRFGTTEYQRLGKFSICQIKDCGNKAVAKGLCDKHRQRLIKHGTTDLVDEARGIKKTHPLYNSWRYLIRFSPKEMVHPSWHTDFLQFIADIGERPSPKHRLYSADMSKPIGPDNFIWKKSLIHKVSGEDEKTYAARYQRAHRAMNPEGYKAIDLKRLYGLSREQYQMMHDAQDGKCAICKEPETTIIRGRQLTLAVDHCHATGAIRGLLCSACNPAIGAFRDRIDLLEAAIAYLRQNSVASSQ